jgi:hypothetical protein
MKISAVEIWGHVLGQDVKVKEFEGTRQEIINHVLSLTPAFARDEISCGKALDDSVWTTKVHWFGGHVIGLKVKAVVPPHISLNAALAAN